VKLGKMTIVGITTQSENKKGKIIDDIETLKERFIFEEISAKIPNKTSNNVILLFSDYENGALGKFSLTLGHRVFSTKNIPKELTIRKVPSLYYKTFTSDKRDDSSFQKWMKLMQKPKQNNLNFKVNFDLYWDGLDSLESSLVENYASVDVGESLFEKFTKVKQTFFFLKE
jgi:predicted transcriptional regulator YdeE